MAEEQQQETVDTQEEVDTQETPMVSVEEMKRRLKKLEDAHKEALEAREAEWEERTNKKVQEATLNGKELEKFKQEQQEREIQGYIDRIKELEQKEVIRELKDEAMKALNEKGLPVNDSILNFVVKDTAEATMNAIDDMASILNEQRNQYAQSKAPQASGSLGAQPSLSAHDILYKRKLKG